MSAKILTAAQLAKHREHQWTTEWGEVKFETEEWAQILTTLDAALAYIRDVQPAVEFADREQSPPGCYTRDLEQHAAILALARASQEAATPAAPDWSQYTVQPGAPGPQNLPGQRP